MNRRNRRFLCNSVTILRSSSAIDVTTIRDRILTGYTTIASSVAAFIEPQGSDVVFDPQLGQIGVDRFTVWLEGGADVQVNDILKNGSVYYEVRGVLDYSGFDFHIRADCLKKTFYRNQ